MGIENHLDNTVHVTNLEWFVNWARKSSMWPLGFGLACCALEMIATFVSRYDLARFGMEVARPSPRDTLHLMIVSGTASKKMLPAVLRIYEQMAEPRWVVAMGACACSGGFYEIIRSFRALIVTCLLTFTYQDVLLGLKLFLTVYSNFMPRS